MHDFVLMNYRVLVGHININYLASCICIRFNVLCHICYFMSPIGKTLD